jgi:hypothetical protein
MPSVVYHFDIATFENFATPSRFLDIITEMFFRFIPSFCAVAALLAPLISSATTSGNSSASDEGRTSHAPQSLAASAVTVAGGYKNAAYFVNW